MKIKFLGTMQGVDGAVWSPVVFPLPTKYGFSESVDAAGAGHDMTQVFQHRVQEGVYLNLPSPYTPMAEIGMLESVKGDSVFRPAAVVVPVFGNGSPSPTTPWRIEMDDTLKARLYTISGLNDLAIESWGRGMVDAYVAIDPNGTPLNVLLDGTSGNTGFDRLMVRMLYSGRGARGEGTSAGRVRLFYRRPENGGADALSR